MTISVSVYLTLGITSYMQGQVGPSSKLISSLKAVLDFMKERDDLVIVGFFADENDKLLEKYLEANNDLRDEYSFSHTFDAAAKKHFGVTKSSIVLFHPEKFRSKYEDPHIVFKVNFLHFEKWRWVLFESYKVTKATEKNKRYYHSFGLQLC